MIALAPDLAYLGLALGGGFVAVRLGMPVFVGYLVAGLALGLGGFQPSELLAQAGEIGVLMLLFGVGLHLSPRNLFSRPVVISSSVHLVVSSALFVLLAWVMGQPPGQALLWGVLLSFSSTVLAAKSLESGGELGTFHGRVAISILIVQDIVAVAVMVAVAQATPSPWALLAVPGVFALRWPLLRLIAAIDSEELLLLVAALMALSVAALFGRLGLSTELGAIAAGVLVAAHPHGETLAGRLWSIKELLLVGFFLSIGMQVSPSLADWATAGVFVAVLPLKTVLFFALLVGLGLRARTAFLAGVSLTSYSEFTLIAASLAHAHGMLTLAGLGVLTLATVVSFGLHLPVNRVSHSLYDRFHRTLERFERDIAHPDEAARTIGAARYLVLGMGRTGSPAYDWLHRNGQQVAGLDTDPETLARNLAANRRVTYGDAQDRALWHALRLDAVSAVVIALPQEDVRLRVTRLLRDRAPHIVISTFAMHDHEAKALRNAGADHVSYLLADAGERLAELSLEPVLAADGNEPVAGDV